MINNSINKIIRAFALDIINTSRLIMSSYVGINKKVGKNTLKDSMLYRQIDYDVNLNDGDNIVVNTLFNYYIVFINEGRRPMTGSWPKEKDIIKWLLRKNIPTSNQNVRDLAYLIRRAIWRDGYAARPVLDLLEKRVDDSFNENWSIQMFDQICEDLEKYFSD